MSLLSVWQFFRPSFPLLSSFMMIFIVICFENSLFFSMFFPLWLKTCTKYLAVIDFYFMLIENLASIPLKRHHTFILPYRLCFFCCCVHTILFILCSQIPSSAQVLLLFVTIFTSFIVFFSSSISLFEFFFNDFFKFFFDFSFFLKLLILYTCCFPDFAELSLCSLAAYWVYENNYSDSLELRNYLFPLVCAVSFIFSFC